MANGVSRRESRLERPRLYREESIFMRDRGLFFSRENRDYTGDPVQSTPRNRIKSGSLSIVD